MKKEDLVVGIIGLSGMGRKHVGAVIAFGAQVGAVCDLSQDALQKTCEEFQISEDKCYTDWHDLVAMSELNTVVIVTPDQLHREMVEAFLAAGKHVLCEKPLALLREDMEAIIAAGRKSDRKLMVGQICHFAPAFAKAKELIEEGAIGEVFFVESEYAHDYVKILRDTSNWRADPKRHGVIGGGCHAVDLLRWFVGDPVEVFSYGNHKLMKHLSYDDATISVLKFPNDVIGKVFVSTGCKRNYTMRTLVYGTKGTIICDNTSDHMELYQAESEDDTAKTPATVIPIDIANHNANREFEVFATHILEDSEVVMSAEEGAKTVAACMAIVESAETGKPVVPNYNF